MDTITKFLKQNKSLVSLGALAVIAFMAWSNREKLKKMLGINPATPAAPPSGGGTSTGSGTGSGSGTGTSTGTGSGTAAGLDYDKVLKLTSPMTESKEGKKLQEMLNAEMTLRKSIPISSDFGKNSLINTVANDVALTVDGKIGDKTIALLNKYAEVRETTINQLKTNSKMFSSPTSPYNTDQAIKDTMNKIGGGIFKF